MLQSWRAAEDNQHLVAIVEKDALALAKAEADCAVYGECYINAACPVLGRVGGDATASLSSRYRLNKYSGYLSLYHFVHHAFPASRDQGSVAQTQLHRPRHPWLWTLDRGVDTRSDRSAVRHTTTMDTNWMAA